MAPNTNFQKALSWKDLSEMTIKESDNRQGPTNSYSLLRLFGQPQENVNVTLYRDNHAWCPYCQKVWLWLEWKRIPYRVKKVTMRCYGPKESSYLEKVPSGLLPALEFDEGIITESDEILLFLEKHFGPLGRPLQDPMSLELRFLERKLFRAWCIWLCSPSLIKKQESYRKEQFKKIAKEFEKRLKNKEGPFLDILPDNSGNSLPGSSDVIFIPFIERMNASLAYYKGFNLREEHPAINKWLTSLEKFDVYRGTQGDFHTHSHDLPPQMGGCYIDSNPQQKQYSIAIDQAIGLDEMEISLEYSEETNDPKPEIIALSRVVKHQKILKTINPIGPERFDQPLRAALTKMLVGHNCQPENGSALGLRYLRDRISVPRDMPLLAARKLRKALEDTAKLDGPDEGPMITTKDRFDQNPKPFRKELTQVDFP